MKHTIKRTLALFIALLLATPTFAFAEAPEDQAIVIDDVSDAVDQELSIESLDIEPPAEEEGDFLLGDPDGTDDQDPDICEGSTLDPGELTGDEPNAALSSPFEQSVDVGDATFTVTAGAGVFPDGAKLRVTAEARDEVARGVEAALGAQGVYTHRLYRVEVLDASDNIFMPGVEQGTPVLRVKGLNLPEDARVIMHDEAQDLLFDVDAIIKADENVIEFSLYDMTVYDILSIEPAPVEEESAEAPDGESGDGEGEPAGETSSVSPDGEPASPEGKPVGDGDAQEPSPDGEGAERSEAEEVPDGQTSADADASDGAESSDEETSSVSPDGEPASPEGKPVDEQSADGEGEADEQPADGEGEADEQPADGESKADEQPANGQEGEPVDEQPADGESKADEQTADGEGDGEPASPEGEPVVEQPTDEEEAIQPVRVVFDTVPETAVVTVWPIANGSLPEGAGSPEGETEGIGSLPEGAGSPEGETEGVVPPAPGPIPAQEDGSFLLFPGEYTYTAGAEGYISAENIPFTVADEPLTLSVALEAVEAEPVAFEQSRTVSGVVVTVQADPGVFPADAELSVKRVPVYKQRQADAAIEDVRDEDQNVAVSYTFDIKVIDPNTKEELQPADGQSVSVSFALEEASDENLEANVYHITDEGGDLTAEKLESDVDGEAVTATTDGFSLYTVEFTYNTLQYVLEGGGSVPLAEILESVGLTGEVEAVAVSDASLFDAVLKDGTWVVESYRAFDSEEWMKVTINAQAYEITVTDDQAPIPYLDENGATQDCTNYTAVTDQVAWGTSSAETWYAVTENATINDRVTVTGNVNLILCDGATLTAKSGITVTEGNSLTVYGQSKGTGALIAGESCLDYCAGIGGINEDSKHNAGKITVNGGTVTATGGLNGAGIGGSRGGAGGTILINGGTVTANGRASAGIGGGEGGAGGNITISGGTVTANGGDCGAGIGGGYGGAGGTIQITGGTVEANGGGCSAGIGGGADGGAGGNITISGGTVTATGSQFGAGIGGGAGGGAGGNITISGGTVTATGGEYGAGIGGGDGGAGTSDNDNITISGGEVTANGGEYGAGIGGGYSGAGGNITISGGEVTANGGEYGAGIGGGNWGAGGTINISGGEVEATGKDGGAGIGGGYGGAGGTIQITGGTVEANGGKFGAGIGGGAGGGAGGNITISGGTVTATGGYRGAGIGGGDGGAGTSDNDNITISGGTVKATGGSDGAGIGGGYRGAGGNITISSGTVEATGGSDGAGIGGGYRGAGGNITISGGEVIATGGYLGAGIGGGYLGAGTSANGNITISGGEVTANGGNYGAGIGGGYGEAGGNITISGGKVMATGKYGGAGIGGGFNGAGGNITISGGEVEATGKDGGAGIGGGLEGEGGNLELGYTETSKTSMRVKASSYKYSHVKIDNGQPFIAEDGTTVITQSNLTSADGKWIFPKVDGAVIVDYVDANNKPMGKRACVEVTYQTITWGTEGKTTWYVVNEDQEFGGDRIIVTGHVNLILRDGETLEVPCGITVSEGNSLTVWAQSGGTGALIAGKSGDAVTCRSGCAGIGGVKDEAGGNITINGGDITAAGGDGQGGAGIGGGGSKPGGNITISGGKVTATGNGGGAGIGGGWFGAGGTIQINGGKVTATGDGYGAGIGGGMGGKGGNITISDGEVTATGGKDGVGIGGGDGDEITISGGEVTANGGQNGAGIGAIGDGGNITINGGKVTAIGGDGGAGIGSGKDGVGGTVVINGGEVEATGNGGGAGIGAGIGGSNGTLRLDLSNAEADAFLKASSYGCTVNVESASGKPVYVTDGSRFYTGELTEVEKDKVANTELKKAAPTPWQKLQTAIHKADTDTTTIKVSDYAVNGSVTAEDGDEALVIAAGQNITLDLDGCTLDRNLTTPADNGNVITVKGTLTLTDSSTAKTGTITGGNNNGDGGGVYVDGGTFNLSGGTISGNATVANGGGVHVFSQGTFTMNGGKITGNAANTAGGGVYVNKTSTFNLSGAPQITGNKIGQDAANNVYLLTGKKINVTGKLTNGASVGVTTQAKPEEAGLVTLTGGLKDNGDLSAFTSDDGKYTIGWNDAGTEAVLGLIVAVTAKGWEGTYDGAAHGIAVTPAVSGATVEYSTDGASWSRNNPTFVDVCDQTVNWRVTATDYLPASGSAKVKITHRTATVTADAKGKTYGNADPALTAKVTGLASGDKASVIRYTLSRASGQNVGTYTITPTGEATQGNYTVTYKTGKLTINRAAATVTADAKSKTYGDADPALTAKVTGLKNGDAASVIRYTLSRASGQNVGSYAITPKGEATQGNYTVTYKNAKLTIGKAAVTVTADAKTKAEGTADPALSYTATGLVNGDALTGALARDPGEAPGTYNITQGTLKAGDNYDLTFNGATLTIKAKSSVPVKPDYTLLARLKATGRNKLILSWSKVKDADGYDVFFARCVKGSTFRKIASVNAPARTCEISGLKNHKAYKANVKAWKRVNGRKTYIGEASPDVHAATGGYNKKRCNAMAVTVKNKEIALAKGKSSTIKASVTGVKKGKTVFRHAKLLRYYSSNANVAKVDDSGKITAVGSGACKIYVMANNGVKASVTVTVVTEPTKVAFKKATYSVKKGKKLNLAKQVKLSPSGVTSTLTWSSSAPTVATVDSKGVVKGVKKGTVTITVTTANGKTAKTKVSVG